MQIEVVYIDGKAWERHAPDARKIVFNEILPPEYDRIDFALLLVDKKVERPVGYMTLRELDSDSVYIKHGGAFPPLKGTFYSMATYLKALAYLQKKYKRITTLVENNNRVYLKMALTAGFKVIGVRHFKGALLVELFLGTED